jgi:hypothetical protein
MIVQNQSIFLGIRLVDYDLLWHAHADPIITISGKHIFLLSSFILYFFWKLFFFFSLLPLRAIHTNL